MSATLSERPQLGSQEQLEDQELVIQPEDLLQDDISEVGQSSAPHEWGVAVEGFGLLPYHATDQPDLAIPVKRYTLTNEKGMMVQVINYGVTITSIRVPDRNGDFDDVLLGFDDFDSYVHNSGLYLGTTIGRVADRISRARFQLDHQVHDLTKNLWNKLHFHGGVHGFSQTVWQSRIEGQKVIFTDLNPHLEEGYPGNLLTTIKMWLTPDNGFKMTIEAVVDVPTPVSITNHACFNLAGHRAGAQALGDHVVILNADKYLVSDKHSIPTGEVKHVGCTNLDLRIHRLLSRLLPNIPGGGFKTNYCVNGGKEDGVRFVARLLHPKTGRVMEMFSNQPVVHFQTSLIYEEEPVDDVIQEMVDEFVDNAVRDKEVLSPGGGDEEEEKEEVKGKGEEKEVPPASQGAGEDEVQRQLEDIVDTGIYSGYSLQERTEELCVEDPAVERKVLGKGGAIYEQDGCFSLMPQAYPDAVNKRHFPDIILRPGEVYNHTLVYKFSTIKKTRKCVNEAADNGPALPALADPEGNQRGSQGSAKGKSASQDSQRKGSGGRAHRPESADTFNFSKEKLSPVYPPFQ